MMDEFKLLDQVKEELCYVSQNFSSELNQSSSAHLSLEKSLQFKSPSKKYFILPDFQSINKGFVKSDDAAINQGEQV